MSDAADALIDAELSGAIIEAHESDDAAGRTVRGVAIFTKGYSLSAIDDPRVKESVKGNDGQDRIGRIVDVTPKMLRIKTAEGVQAIPIRYIVEVKSPRAFAFSLPMVSNAPPDGPSASGYSAPSQTVSSANGSLSSAGIAGPRSPESLSAAPASKTLVSFSSTYSPDLNSLPAINQTKTLHAQLTERHPNRRALKMAAVTAGVIACFAIPTAIAVTCPRPKGLGGGSSSGGAGQ